MGIAQSVGKTPAQVLLRWGIQHGDNEHISVIPKSSNPLHLKVQARMPTRVRLLRSDLGA